MRNATHMLVLYMSYSSPSPIVLYLEAVPSHTLLVVVDESEALFLGVVGCREEHTFVAFSLLVRADTACYQRVSTRSSRPKSGRNSRLTLAGAAASLRSEPMLAAVGGARIPSISCPASHT
jgi:hypothetical protein